MTPIECAIRTYDEGRRLFDDLHDQITVCLKPIVQPYARLMGYERWPLDKFEIVFVVENNDLLITPVPNREIGFMPPFRVPKSFVYATDEIRQGMLDAMQREKDVANDNLRRTIERSEREQLVNLLRKYGIPNECAIYEADE
jgi:hypothetical protein